MRAVYDVSSTEQLEAVDKILTRRLAQDDRWGGPGADDRNTHGDWVRLITEYSHGTGPATRLEFARRMEHAAALALAAMESARRAQRREEGTL